MTIYLAADHRGFALKALVLRHLRRRRFSAVDCGNDRPDSDDDYPDFAHAAAWRVVRDPASRGILICGSGAGMVIAANKVRGIRAAVARIASEAQAARHDEDINVLCLAADHADEAAAKRIVDAFLGTEASPDARHVRRRLKLEA